MIGKPIYFFLAVLINNYVKLLNFRALRNNATEPFVTYIIIGKINELYFKSQCEQYVIRNPIWT